MKKFRRKEREVVHAIQFVQTKECIDQLKSIFGEYVFTLIGNECNDNCTYHHISDAIRRGATPEMFQAVILNFNNPREAKALPSYWLIINDEGNYSALSDREFHDLFEESI